MAEIGVALGWVDPDPPAPLPAARVVLPWWARLAVFLMEPPPVRPRELTAGPAEVTIQPDPAGGPLTIDDIVAAARRLRGDPVDLEAVLAVAQRVRVAGATVAEVAAAIERAMQRMAPENMRDDHPPEREPRRALDP